MSHLIWLIPALPLVGVLVNGFFGRWTGRLAGWIASGLVAGSFLVALSVMWPVVHAAGPGYRDFTLYQWLTQDPSLLGHLPALSVPLAIRADALSLVMVLVVTGIGAVIHFYAIGYMAEDERIPRFFTFLNLFTFAMLVLVLANNYLFMFVGWEGVGLCSYLLIGFWFEKPSAASAAKKAMLVNRVGDWGFILAMLAMLATFGTLTFTTPSGTGIFDQVMLNTGGRFAVGAGVLTGITLGLMWAAVGKSAQLPLYLWLPDAMEGPTPVSALMHAATMVTAGVYLVARSSALFSRAPFTEAWVASLGAATALFAAIIAVVQYDIKRVLAYSTVSQIGYMFIGVGVGAYATGIFHLVTHAFFKGLLFLCAGSVMHALAGELDMRRMGSLGHVMKITVWTFLCGWLAISGVWPFAGFFSKDAILSAALERYPAVAWIGLAAAGLTAFYMTRLWSTAFWGPSRLETPQEAEPAGSRRRRSAEPAAARHAQSEPSPHAPHECPRIMWVPLVILAAGSVLSGAVLNGSLLPRERTTLSDFLSPAFHWALKPEDLGTHAGLLSNAMPVISFLVAVGGIALAWYRFHLPGIFARGWRPGFWTKLVEERFYYDWLLHYVFVSIGTVVAEVLSALVDQLTIDGIVNGTGASISRLSQWIRNLQSGFVRYYALIVLTGVVFIFLTLMLNWQR
jgi:NADH-quinone oxidoreductase subunit L